MAGWRRPALIAAFRVAIASGGVALGAIRPVQGSRSKPATPASRTVGVSGMIALRSGALTARARISFRRIAAEIEGATMVEPRYRGVDERNRPYTVTAEKARQSSQDRIDLVAPKADITMEDGRWLMLQSRKGVYIQSEGHLDLSDDVTLYRDDGTTMTTATASIDLKAGAALSADPVHVEGPFGSIDAQGFVVTDKGAALVFTGPAKAILNGASR